MSDTVSSFGIFRAFLLFMSFLSAHGRMSIQPTVVYVTSSTTTTQTPTYVTIECNVQGLTVQTVFSMYIHRMSFPLAEISLSPSGPSQPVWSTTRPSDVAGKNPLLEGNVNQGSGSYLRVRYLQQSVDCRDGVTYHCKVNYKPNNGETTTFNSSASLTVHVLPDNPQIIAGRVQNGVVQSVTNRTIVRSGEVVQLECMGDIGSSNTVLMEWYYRTNQIQSYQRLYQTGAGVSIDDGIASQVNICHYARTSKLTYTIQSNDVGLAIRCEVPSQQQAASSVSPEFQFTFDGSVSSGSRISGLSVAFVVVTLNKALLNF